MGVPVLTLSGRGFAARVCASLVRAAGLPELICDSAEAYVELAVGLADNKPAVEGLKAKLEAARATCDLFNMEKLTAKLEDLYRGMVQDYQKGKLPKPDLSNLDIYHAVGAEEDHDRVEMGLVADYHGLYRAKLAKRSRIRPIAPDKRLWSKADAGSGGFAPNSAHPGAECRDPDRKTPAWVEATTSGFYKTFPTSRSMIGSWVSAGMSGFFDRSMLALAAVARRAAVAVSASCCAATLT